MKSAMRLVSIFILVVVVQPGNVYAETIRDNTTVVAGYSGSFVFDSTSSFTLSDRLFADRDHPWTRPDTVAMPSADSQNAVSETPTMEPDDPFDLLRPERSSGERIAGAPIEAAIVPEPMSVVLLAGGLLPLLRRKWRG
jgi:hypothetical protein